MPVFTFKLINEQNSHGHFVFFPSKLRKALILSLLECKE